LFASAQSGAAAVIAKPESSITRKRAYARAAFADIMEEGSVDALSTNNVSSRHANDSFHSTMCRVSCKRSKLWTRALLTTCERYERAVPNATTGLDASVSSEQPYLTGGQDPQDLILDFLQLPLVLSTLWFHRLAYIQTQVLPQCSVGGMHCAPT